MLDLEAATDVVNKSLPDSVIYKSVEHGNLFLFLVLIPDAEESGFDPFFSVNRDTGEFSDFAIFASEEDSAFLLSKFQDNRI